MRKTQPIQNFDTLYLSEQFSDKRKHHIADRKVWNLDILVSCCGHEMGTKESCIEIEPSEISKFNICKSCKNSKLYKELLKEEDEK